jgi:Domain of unknown function (DUF6766)
MKRFLRNNGLALVFLLLFIVSLIGQFSSGYLENNKEREERGGTLLSFTEYGSSGHFIQAHLKIGKVNFYQCLLL